MFFLGPVNDPRWVLGSVRDRELIDGPWNPEWHDVGTWGLTITGQPRGSSTWMGHGGDSSW